MNTGTFRQKLKQGMPQLGIFIASSDPVVIEVAGVAGMDFCVLDLEHGGVYYDRVENACRAADAAGIDLIVRVPHILPNSLFRPLDSGATGVQVPQVNDREMAKMVCANVKYAPEGCRGGARPRSSRWGTRPDYFARANTETVTVIHCETKECVANLDSVLTVPGIDVVFAGPQDLSHSYGVPGDTANPVVQEAIATMLAAAKKHGVAPGIFVNNADEAKKRIEQGFTYLLFTNDQALLLNMLKSILSAVGLKR
jgi:4-hydroxy-2-oxoheptanedioate aldolase